MDNNMWQPSMKSEPTCEPRQMMRGFEEERQEKCKPPVPPKPKCPGGCSFVYDVSYVQLFVRDRDRYIEMVQELDHHLKKHYQELYAGLQLYQTGGNSFVVVTRYYDKPDCKDELPGIHQYVCHKYTETFGRNIRRTQVLGFKEAARLYC